MSLENKTEIFEAVCEHLANQHGGTTVVANIEFPANSIRSHTLPKDLIVGSQGICLAGKYGRCPKHHACKEVKVSYTNYTVLFIEPLKVELPPYAASLSDECSRPPKWFHSKRAEYEKDGYTEVDGKKVSDMSWDPKDDPD